MLIIQAHPIVCTSCYSGDLVPSKAIKGRHRKTKIQRIDCTCNHCGVYVKGNWEYEIVESWLDKIDDGIAQIREQDKYGRYNHVINDVSTRVTDSLLSDDNENSYYLKQQYSFVHRLLSHFKEEKATS